MCILLIGCVFGYVGVPTLLCVVGWSRDKVQRNITVARLNMVNTASRYGASTWGCTCHALTHAYLVRFVLSGY